MKKFKKILVVDDEEILRFASKILIEEIDLAEEILEAPNGLKALDILLDDKRAGKPEPDLIILDLQMPVMDGLEFIEVLPQLDGLGKLLDKVVVVSASRNPRHEQEVKSKGVKWFLQKPVSRELFERVLDSVVLTPCGFRNKLPCAGSDLSPGIT